MISVHIEQKEYWNEQTGEFLDIGPKEPMDLKLEHSLYSISKWEAKYHKFYVNNDNKTIDETLDYFAMMVVGEEEIDKDYFLTLSEQDIMRIKAYIEDPMTATTISESKSKVQKGKIHGENISAELVYYYMTAFNIPFECQYWHFNKLITLIKVCSIMNDPDRNKKKKMTSADKAARKARMDAARAKYKH